MPAVGDAATDDHFARLVTEPHEAPGVSYQPFSDAAAELVDPVRYGLLERLGDAQVLRFDWDAGPTLGEVGLLLGELGRVLTEDHGLREPYGGLVNRDLVLAYHVDVTMPRPATVLMATLRSEAHGGYLALPELDVGLACDDGWAVAFDGSKVLHGVTPLDVGPGGYRISIAYYIPL